MEETMLPAAEGKARESGEEQRCERERERWKERRMKVMVRQCSRPYMLCILQWMYNNRDAQMSIHQ